MTTDKDSESTSPDSYISIRGEAKRYQISASGVFQEWQLIRRPKQRVFTDIKGYLKAIKPLLRSILYGLLAQKVGFKVQLAGKIEYAKLNENAEAEGTVKKKNYTPDYQRTDPHTVLNVEEVSHSLSALCSEVCARNAEFLHSASNLVTKQVHRVDLYAARYNPLGGCLARELPPIFSKKSTRCVFLARKVPADGHCFLWAIAAAQKMNELELTKNNNTGQVIGMLGRGLLPSARAAHAEIRDRRKHLDHLRNNMIFNTNCYRKYFNALKQHSIQLGCRFPMTLRGAIDFDRRNKQAINIFIYTFTDNSGLGRTCLYFSKNKKEEHSLEVPLLLWDDHWYLITKWPRFFTAGNKRGRHTHFPCKRCMKGFQSAKHLAFHERHCDPRIMSFQNLILPGPETQCVFNHHAYGMRAPFVIYADFEAFVLPLGREVGEQAKQVHFQGHAECAASFLVRSLDPGYQTCIRTHIGLDSAEWLLDQLLEVSEELIGRLQNHRAPEKRTEEDLKRYAAATECYYCGARFFDEPVSQQKVSDHDHVTGEYRGAAHSGCNLKLRTVGKVSVFFHNFKRYDSHFIIQALTNPKYRALKIKPIAQNLENIMVLEVGEHLQFKDSFLFLGQSLDSLTATLKQSGTEHFHALAGYIADPEKTALLLRKGVFPYEYMDSPQRLLDDHLPPKEAFYSQLTGRGISEEDYTHAHRVWDAFECENMQAYLKVYLEGDVCQLCDVFENFRDRALDFNHLDPAYYISTPQFCWDAMLRTQWQREQVDRQALCERMELMSDITHYQLLERGMRGGICMISKRRAVGNNKYMDNYDPGRPSIYIIDLDANNLYGWALSQPLPFRGFRWVIDFAEKQEIIWLIKSGTLDIAGSVGYILDVDLSYPAEVHDAHNDYPLAPERFTLKQSMLSQQQCRLLRDYNLGVQGDCVKLVPNLCHKKHYVLHSALLQFYLKHGLVLDDVHSILRFEQKPILKDYVDQMTEKRANATSSIERDFYKLFVNAIYGKSCENLRRRAVVTFETDPKRAEHLVQRMDFRSWCMINKHLIGILRKKTNVRIDKPSYLGFSVLEYSKLLMYRTYYERLQPVYKERMHLCMTDTDSLVLEVQTDDVFEDMRTLPGLKELFDFSNYPKQHPNYSEDNKSMVGYFKDEMKGQIVTEFIGLRPKMYSIEHLDSEGQLVSEMRAKGIKREVVKSFTHALYRRQLEQPSRHMVHNVRIQSYQHRIYTTDCPKRALCSFDNKRFILENNIETMALGNARIALGLEIVDLPLAQQEHAGHLNAERDELDVGEVEQKRQVLVRMLQDLRDPQRTEQQQVANKQHSQEANQALAVPDEDEELLKHVFDVETRILAQEQTDSGPETQELLLNIEPHSPAVIDLTGSDDEAHAVTDVHEHQPPALHAGEELDRWIIEHAHEEAVIANNANEMDVNGPYAEPLAMYPEDINEEDTEGMQARRTRMQNDSRRFHMLWGAARGSDHEWEEGTEDELPQPARGRRRAGRGGTQFLDTEAGYSGDESDSEEEVAPMTAVDRLFLDDDELEEPDSPPPRPLTPPPVSHAEAMQEIRARLMRRSLGRRVRSPTPGAQDAPPALRRRIVSYSESD